MLTLSVVVMSKSSTNISDIGYQYNLEPPEEVQMSPNFSNPGQNRL